MTDKDSKGELKPCPCCESVETNVQESATKFSVVCLDCGLSSQGGDRETAIERWNTRPITPKEETPVKCHPECKDGYFPLPEMIAGVKVMSPCPKCFAEKKPPEKTDPVQCLHGYVLTGDCPQCPKDGSRLTVE